MRGSWHFGKKSNGSAPTGAQVLSTDRAMNEYGLTREELNEIESSGRHMHGNYYPVWNVRDLSAYREEKGAKLRKLKIEEDENKENMLIQEFGVEGLKRKREEETIVKNQKIKEEREIATRNQNIHSMASLMIAIRKSLGTQKLTALTVTPETILAKPQAKEMFGLTDGKLRECSDLGPSGRSKSSYKVCDLMRKASNDTHLIQRLKLEELKGKNPELINEAAVRCSATLRGDCDRARILVANAKSAMELAQRNENSLIENANAADIDVSEFYI